MDYEQFKREVIELGRKHGFLISHQDDQGGFIIVDRKTASDKYINILERWFLEADLEKK